MKSMVIIGFATVITLLIIVSCGKTQSCIDPSKVTSGYYNCGTLYDPVCGCDNVTYQNSCAAQNRGVVQWIQGPCP